MTGTRLKLCSPSELRMRALTKEATKTKVCPKRTNRHRHASHELNPDFYHDRESISSTRSSPSRLFRSSSVSVVPIIGVSVVPIVFPRILVRGSNPDGCPKSRERGNCMYFLNSQVAAWGIIISITDSLPQIKFTELPIERIRNLEIFGMMK